MAEWKTIITIWCAGALATVGLIGVIKYLAPRLSLIQYPKERSSHLVPTPAGGGIAIALVTSLGWCWPFSASEHTWWIPCGLGLGLALLGLLDDIRPLTPKLRLLIQAVICLVLFEWVKPELSVWSWLFAMLCALWWLNLYNFMDGIDGLAGSQAIFMLVSAAFLAFLHDPAVMVQPLWQGMGLLAAATAGFLIWNWPPARIFMGDAGSMYLGFMILFLALVSVEEQWLNLATWLILAALFVCDATTTLFLRLWRRENIWQAHRQHAYQRLARRFGAHQPVTVLALFVNLLFVLPIAITSMRKPDLAWIMVVLTYVTLLAALSALHYLKDSDA